jgi:hypothetical protein
MRVRRISSLISVGLVALLVGAASGHGRGWLAPEDRLDDATYFRLFVEFSEPNGFFQSDNLVSNETTYPALIPEIAKRASDRSAYVGVGPEQNFSYIAALRPRIAFIVDIRRQNAMLHLLYKAVFEASATRADFLSVLFSRGAPSLPADASIERLLEAFRETPPDTAAFDRNLADIRHHLTKTRGFALTDEDFAGIKYVYTAFFEEGPALQYSFGAWRRARPFPTFAELMTATDDRGIVGSFLATEETYGAIRDLQRRNLIVPVVGDFAGGRALQSVASYLKGRGFTMTVLYTSNVEQYLFRSEDWRNFYANVALFPVATQSVLVRSVFNRNVDPFIVSGGPWPWRRGTLHLDPIESLNRSFERGEIASYQQILARSR